MLPRTGRSAPSAFLTLVLALGLLSCGRDATGPGRDATAQLALDPRFPAPFAVAGAGSVVPFNRVRVVLQDVGGSPVVDRTIAFPADEQSISLTIDVPLPPDAGSDGLPLVLHMRYINAQGDTVFRAGPIEVTAVPFRNSETPPVTSFDVEYVGVGADAAIVFLSPDVSSAVAGTSTAFTALVFDAQENPLPGTPIIFSTPDPQSVQLSAAGVATWLPVPGLARVIATVPTGAAADTMFVTVGSETPAGAMFEWTGAVSADWADAGNWSLDAVPGATDSVFVPAGTPAAPVLSAATTVGTVALAPSATLSLGAHILEVRGSVDVQDGAAITATEGRLELSSAAGGSVRGVLPETRVEGGLFTLSGDLTINGTLETYGAEFTPGVMTEGDVSVGSHTLTITGGLFTGLGGTFTMMGPGVVDIGTFANFFGNSTAGKLTDGVMRVRGDFDQDGTDSPSSFSASGNHVVELTGNAVRQRIRFTDPDASPSAACLASCFATLRSVKPAGDGGLLFGSSVKVLGQLDLQADSVIATDMIIMAAGTPRINTPILRAAALGWQDSLVVNAPTLELDELVAWGGDTLLVGVGDVPNLVMGAYYLRGPLEGSVIVSGTVGALTITGAADIAGDLTIIGAAGMLSPDVAITLNIGGNLAVLGTGRFISTGAGHLTTVQGSALFDGDNATELQTGRLRVAGDIIQAATTSPFSLRTSAAFIIEPTGDGIISFATPGQSTIGNLFITGNDITRTLLSDVTVLDWVDLNGDGLVLQSDVLGAGGTRRITSQRVTAGSAGGALRNVALGTQDFQPGLGLTLSDFDPSVVQIDIAAPSGTSRVANVTFATQPTGNGRYVRIMDTNGAADGSPTLEVSGGVSPTFHGGWAEAIAPATLTGWLMPTFRWTGAVSSDWLTAANWSDGIVPTVADSVHIPATFVNTPALPANGVSVRRFISDYTEAPLPLTGTLRVIERLSVPMSSGVVCVDGSVVLDAGAGVATISGLIDGCLVRATSGTVAAANTVRILNGDLQVEGTTLFETARQAVHVGGNFATLDEGRLAMRTEIDSLIVGNGVTFGGGSTAGLLTAGVIEVGGNFTQTGRNADSFAASGTHTTRFVGVVPQMVSFDFPGSGLSHFGHLQLAQQNVEAWVQLNTSAFADGVLSTDELAQTRQLRNAPAANLPVAMESHGADVSGISFEDITWTILDGAPIGLMQNITFSSTRDNVVHLTMERDADDVTINTLTFNTVQPRTGLYIRLFDPNEAGVFSVTVNGATPSSPSTFFDVPLPALLVWNGVPVP